MAGWIVCSRTPGIPETAGISDPGLTLSGSRGETLSASVLRRTGNGTPPAACGGNKECAPQYTSYYNFETGFALLVIALEGGHQLRFQLKRVPRDPDAVRRAVSWELGCLWPCQIFTGVFILAANSGCGQLPKWQSFQNNALAAPP